MLKKRGKGLRSVVNPRPCPEAMATQCEGSDWANWLNVIRAFCKPGTHGNNGISSREDTRWYLNVDIRGSQFNALVDSGSTLSYIGRDGLPQMEELGASLVSPLSEFVTLADNSQQKVVGKVELPVRLKGRSSVITFFVLPQLSVPLVLGQDFLSRMGLIIDTAEKTWFYKEDVRKRTHRFNLPQELSGSPSVSPALCLLSESQEKELSKFLEVELRLFEEGMGKTDLCKHFIDTGTQRPLKQRHYQVSPRIHETMVQEVDEMLAKGVIEPSKSAWSSPVVMVKKPNDTYRFCLDFRRLNSVSKRDAYPVPLIHSILDKLRDARYLSTIDLKNAYWQIPLEEESKEKTAFTVPGKGLFHFTVMPFGLHGASATFQRLLDRLIGPELEPHAFAYLDDIIITSRTFKEHLEVLGKVFRKLREARLQINREKSRFVCSELKYLGHVVNHEGLQADPEKVEPIVNFPTPRNLRQLRRFLGLCSWYRRFIPKFATITEPLIQLLRKGVKWEWGKDQQAAMKELKAKLTCTPILACPDFDSQFCLQTDASFGGIGAVLTQGTKETERVIAYASRALTKEERKWTVTEKEYLAVVWSVKKFRPYLEGYHFSVITDHHSLKWVNELKNPSGRLARWALELQQFDYEVIHRKGALHHVPDALSRIPECEENGILSAIHPIEVSQDTWYSSKLKEVQTFPEKYPDWKAVGDNIWCLRKETSGSLVEEVSDPWKLCISKESREAVLKENHDLPTAGHLGIKKTYDRVKRNYYWPGMYRYIVRYVRKCVTCQTHKVEQQRAAGYMGTRVVENPWTLVATDLMGPLPRSKKGYSFILVFQDLFTKWVECIPLRKASGEAIIEAFLSKVVYRWGVPKFLISDNAGQYVNDIMKRLANQLGTTLSHTPPYHPQANPVERVNRVMKTMIACYVEGNHQSWDQHLDAFMFALNTSVHESTGYTPALLNYGRELEVPKAVRSGIQQIVDVERTLPQDRMERLKKLEEVYELVRDNLKEAYEKQSKYYNRNRRQVKFRVNDMVLRRNFVLSSAAQNFTAKLAPKFIGPYRVSKILSPTVYVISSLKGKDAGKWHVSDLRPFYK